MNINPYYGLPAICGACLRQISDESEVIHINFPTDFLSIQQRLAVGLPSLDPSAVLCRDCYSAVDAIGNKDYFSNGIKSMLNESDDNRNELLTYKILSDILREGPLPDNHLECSVVADKQAKVNLELCMLPKDAECKLELFNCLCCTGSNLFSPGCREYPTDCGSRDLSTYGRIAQTIQHHKATKSHKCSHCEFSATSKSKLKLHRETHTQQDSLQNNNTLLTRTSKQRGHKPYQCTECQFRCGSKSYLNVHMRIHTGLMPYKCAVCGYSTTFKYSLSVHMRLHTGEKPYRCTQCEFRCSTKSYLDTHMRIHTGEMPYKCNICGYCTAFKYTLTVHMRTHLGNKPYECVECKFRCSSESYLKKHMKMHSGETYTCSVCPYSATFRAAVTLHMKTHTGEKPYKCTWCDYRAYKKYDVRKHKKIHTKHVSVDVVHAATMVPSDTLYVCR